MIQKLLIVVLAVVVLGGGFLGMQLQRKSSKILELHEQVEKLEQQKQTLFKADSVKGVALVYLKGKIEQVRADSSNAVLLHKQQIEQMQTVIKQVRSTTKQQVDLLTKQVDLLKDGVIVRTIRISTHKPCLGRVKVDSTVTERAGY